MRLYAPFGARGHVFDIDSVQGRRKRPFGLRERDPNHVDQHVRTGLWRVFGVFHPAGRTMSSALIRRRSRPCPPCGPRMPLIMPSRTRACSTGSRCGAAACGARPGPWPKPAAWRRETPRRSRQQWQGYPFGTIAALLDTHGNQCSGNRLQSLSHLDDEQNRQHHRPVEPNPPAPRGVSFNDRTSCICARATGATTIWAIRIPRVIGTGAAPRLTSST